VCPTLFDNKTMLFFIRFSKYKKNGNKKREYKFQ
jgi:hypothetical protein